MSKARSLTPGHTRSCPHCSSEILESALVCPACRHHVRFDTADRPAAPISSALNVDGTIRHPGGAAWEYTVVVAIRNEKGAVVSRKAISIGALKANEERSFSVSVEVTGAGANRPSSAGVGTKRGTVEH